MKHLLLALLITLLAFGTACGQAAEPEAEPVANDGIQVHGHWTVTVTNPDGTIDAVHEFENAYGNQGVITPLLAGLNNIDDYIIHLRHNSSMEFGCEEQYSSATTIHRFSYLEADFVIEYAQKLPFTISAFCTVIAGDGPVSVDEVSVYVVDLDNGFCSYRGASYSESPCTIHSKSSSGGVTANPSWPSSFGLETLSGTNSNIPVYNGQKLAINVEYSFG